LVLVISNYKNANSHMYEEENESKICYTFLFTSECLFYKETQNKPIRQSSKLVF